MSITQRLSCSVAAAAVLAALGFSPARAADMPAVPEIQDAAPAGATELGSNWYIRADLGIVDWHAPDLTAGSGYAFTGEKLKTSWSGGAGAGYDFGWMRTDVTVDYISAQNIRAAYSVAANSGTVKGRLAALPVLANVYLNLGTWSGFTPYVGAGAGAAQVTSTRYETDESKTGVSVFNNGDDSWNFAWAAMAGTSYQLSQNLSLDLGYRFLGIANGKAVRSYTTEGLATPAFGSLAYKDLYAHEVRVGLRYLID